VLTFAAAAALALGAPALAAGYVRRPPSEKIPPGIHLIRVSAYGELAQNQPRQQPISTTSPARIKRVVALFDALPAAQPGLRHCPVDFGVRLRVAFYAPPRAAALAVAVVDPEGCGGVTMRIRGLREPGLESYLPASRSSPALALTTVLDRALGVKLDLRRAQRT
jgi:hypothetical protein